MNFDLLVHEAWPAYEQQSHDGWLLRYAGGVTKRANSVLALNTPADLDGAIRAAEAFYGERGARCVFSVGPGATRGLDEELERRGYELVDPTCIMARPPEAGPETEGAPDKEVRIEDRPWHGWLETWWAVDGRYDDGVKAAERVCTGVPAWYAAFEEDGVALAVGRAVPQGDTLGIYCMATLPEARRRGLARMVLRALTQHAGTASAYLVVTARNEGAQALYRSEGFELAARYHYRVR
ncbi:GNAT family N-acetyltransferase [Nonomuraea aridisoli]|uniref:N-acetyltransferase n=1 Tax=Nonomuraea aridisoli TaxID=2070368 RepID=A0A2W2F9T0_9ACTN|nr:GNAT family N-acetyltransferase [Nonomuraea aridisoli]PZG22280.1 N-acetyltransferase [Nonomuraea aridisoli]